MQRPRHLYLFQCNPGEALRYALTFVKNGDNLPISECVSGWRYVARLASLGDPRLARLEDRPAALVDLERHGIHVWDPRGLRQPDPTDPDASVWSELGRRLDMARASAETRNRQDTIRELDAALRLLRGEASRPGG